MYLALCYFEKDQIDKAMMTLNTIPTSDKRYNKANWYMALAKLRMGQLSESKALLQQLTIIDTYYSEDAKQLLDALN